MPKPTYKEQFDKLTRAYIEDRVKPMNQCACFVGNLLNGKDAWACARGTAFGTPTVNLYGIDAAKFCILQEADGIYTVQEILSLEKEFMVCVEYDGSGNLAITEDGLFQAFEKTIELLKHIHISKGENVDETTVFEKRKLVNH